MYVFNDSSDPSKFSVFDGGEDGGEHRMVKGPFATYAEAEQATGKTAPVVDIFASHPLRAKTSRRG